MLSLFTHRHFPRGQISLVPKTPWYIQRIQENVKRQQDYAASIAKGVYANHPLVQAIKHAGDYQLGPVELQELADSRYSYIAKALKFTTEFNRGTFDALKIYPSRDSMIYASSEYVRPFGAVANWMDLKPVKCLWSDAPFVDMSIPDNRLPVKDHFTSVSVDIPLMALMYKGFKESRRARELSGELSSVLGEEHFVAMHVLPSILNSQVDVTCMSAMIAVFEGRYEDSHRVSTHMYLPSYAADYRYLCTKILERITDTRMQYVHILQHIPGIYQTNALEYLQLPDFAETTQVNWAMMVARLKVINFLLEVGGATGRKANNGFIQQLKSYMRRIESAGIPYASMSPELGEYVKSSLIYIKKL